MTQTMHSVDYLPCDSNGERRRQREQYRIDRTRRVLDEVDGFTSDTSIPCALNIDFSCALPI